MRPAAISARLPRLIAIGLTIGLCVTGALMIQAQAPTKTKQERPARTKQERATVPAARDGAWLKMHEEYLKRTKEGKIDLLFLGDSITQGWLGGAEPGKKSPQEVWDKFYVPRNAANFGIGGDRTQNILWRINHGEVDGIKPKVVVLMIGTNNVHADTPAEIADGIAAIVKLLRKKLPETKVLLLGVFPRGPKPDSTRDRLKSVNLRIQKLDDGKMIRYLDIGPKFLDEDGTASQEIMPDFIHLSGKGYQIWAEAIEPTLKEMMGEG
jgi:lysophospholipase L1-like esterase